MTTPDMIILYVDSPANSVRFYTDLFDKSPIEASVTFALFALDSGLMLGLWSKHTVEPAAQTTGGGGELAFPQSCNEDVDALFDLWRQQNLHIAQAPTYLDFGYTFVVTDPDGHRLRVFSPAG